MSFMYLVDLYIVFPGGRGGKWRTNLCVTDTSWKYVINTNIILVHLSFAHLPVHMLKLTISSKQYGSQSSIFEIYNNFNRVFNRGSAEWAMMPSTAALLAVVSGIVLFCSH